MLKQSTAATIKFGPFVDDTDGKTAETGLTIGQADIRLSKNGGDFAQTNNETGATHDENGYYDIPLDTTDTNTLGILRVSVSKSGALPVWQDFMVVTANVYDTLCSTSSLNVNVASLSTDAITAASLKADAVTEIQNGLATAAALSAVDDLVDDLESRLTAARAGYLDKLNVSGTLANTDNANSFKADVSNLALEATLTAIKGTGWSNETLKAIKEYVDELESRLTAVRAGYLDNLTKLDANVSSRLATSGYTAPDNANILNIKAKTDNLPATPADEATLTAIKGAGWSNETLKAIKEYVDELETRLTAVRAAYLDKLNVSGTLANTDNASAFKADVSNLALEATLTAIKGSGWTNETLKAIKEYVDDLENRLTAARAGYLDKLDVSGDLANTANADTFKADVSDLALEATLEAIMGAGWSDETLVALMLAIEAISTCLGATPQEIWEYVSRTLTDASGLGLATDTALSVTDGKVDAIKAKTDNLPANPAPANEYDAELAALQSSVNAIAPLDEVLIDTGTQQFTTADLIKIVAAKMVGKASGGGTTSIVYRNIEDSVDIIIETVDDSGNRSNITLAP